MVVQAMWDRDSPLKQIPHFTKEVIEVANEFGYVSARHQPSSMCQPLTLSRIKDILDFMDAMNPDENPQGNLTLYTPGKMPRAV